MNCMLCLVPVLWHQAERRSNFLLDVSATMTIKVQFIHSIHSNLPHSLDCPRQISLPKRHSRLIFSYPTSPLIETEALVHR